jgi:hypothetical protein
VLKRFIDQFPEHAAALRRYATVQFTYRQPTREEIEAERVAVEPPPPETPK